MNKMSGRDADIWRQIRSAVTQPSWLFSRVGILPAGIRRLGSLLDASGKMPELRAR